MKVIEQFLMAKSGKQESCEDAIFVNDYYVAVLDGATSKSAFTRNGKASGRIAIELLMEILPTLKENLSSHQVFPLLNNTIADFYIKEGLYDHMKLKTQDRCTVGGMVMYSRHFNELWFAGDCQAMVNGKRIGHDTLIDYLCQNVRSFFLESEILSGKKEEELLQDDTGRAYVLPLIQRQTSFQNLDESEYAYGCIDGFFHNMNTVKTVKIPPRTDFIVLASDGYPVLFPTLDETEDKLKRLLQEDPLMYRKFKSTKGLVKGNVSYDDRAYIKFSLE